VIVGSRSARATEVMRELYEPFVRTLNPILEMSPESAEMSKYAANAMLAARISLMNEIANLCETLGADVEHVRRGVGLDARIGRAFLFPGVGYGGSCFPKDVKALVQMAGANQVPPRMLRAIDEVNTAQKRVLFTKLERHFGGRLTGLRIAVWGLSFKPRTDDMREAPAIAIIEQLLERGATVRAYDPEATATARRLFGDRITLCERSYDALAGADALTIVTEWNEFREPNFARMIELMRRPVVFDGRNIYSPEHMRALGFTYFSIGR
jgi:UDPglucose 6-dehydrogenase